MKNKYWILTGLTLCFISCKKTTNQSQEVTQIIIEKLNLEQAENISKLPLHCLRNEYPNKLGQTLGSATDLKTPKTLRPAFYGCFDWHSSVHGFWSLVTLLDEFPQLKDAKEIERLLDSHITQENIALEIDFFNDKNNTSFERTYGWIWLMKLQESLNVSKNKKAGQWAQNLQPLTDLLVQRYEEYLPKLLYPIRTGTHDNSAFSLSMALDYAQATNNKTFETLLKTNSLRLYEKDSQANLAYEPSGHDFLSPIIEEANLMSKIMDANRFKTWLKNFLPEIFSAGFTLEPAKVSDRTDGHLVHLDGLNFSRAYSLYSLAKKLPELAHLKTLANKHLMFSINNIHNDDYMGSHWLGTFALRASLESQQ